MNLEACVEIPIPGLTAGPGGFRNLLAPPAERPQASEDPTLAMRDLSGLMSDLAALQRQIYDLQHPGLASLAQTARLRGFPPATSNNGSSILYARDGHKHIGTQGGVAYERTIPWYIPGSLVAGSNQGAEYTIDGVDLPSTAVITLKKATARVKTAPVGASIIIDITYTPSGGAASTVFTTRITIAAGATSATSEAFVLPNSRVIGGVFRVNIDQVGGTTPGSSLTIQLTILQLTTQFTIIS